MATHTLKVRRQLVGITQDQAASYFGVKTYNTIRGWETGKTHPRELDYRSLWMTFLLDNLRLRHNHAEFFEIWQIIMVEQWGWKQVSQQEAHYFHLLVPDFIQSSQPSDSQVQTRPVLTVEQHQVMQYVMEGKTTKEIVHCLNLRGSVSSICWRIVKMIPALFMPN